MNRSRSGFTLHLVIGAAMLVGLLAFSLQYYASFVNKQAHRLTHGDVAANLASSGLTLVVARLNQSFVREEAVVPSLGTGAALGWRALIGRSPKDLAALLGTTPRDIGAVMEKISGPRWRDALDAMESAFPGSRIEIQLEAEVTPLTSGPFQDPVEKKVRLLLTARATWQGVERSVKAGVDMKVTHPAAPAVGKFTLFARETSGDFNLFASAKGGAAPEGQYPFVLENTPPAEVQGGRDDPTLLARQASAEEIRGALSRRGHIYLGGNRLDLNLADGTSGYGQFHQIHDPARFPDGQLKLDWTEPPDFFNFPDGATLQRIHRYPDPTDQYDQYPGIEMVYFGYHQGLESDPVLGDAVNDGRASILQLFGDRTRPSRTVVHGDVWQRIPVHARMRMVSVLRSSSETFDTLGAPPDRSRAFPYCPSDEAYQEDLAREERGETPQYLADVARQFGIAGVEAPFVVDAAAYRHRAMFGERRDASTKSGYAQLMSRIESLRMNDIIDAMRYPDVFPPSQMTKDPRWKPVLEGQPEDYLHVRKVPLESQDPLHQMIDAPLTFGGDLEAFTREEEGRPSPLEELVLARVTRVVDSPAEFMERYLVVTPQGTELRLNENVLIEEGDLALPAVWFQGRGMIVLQQGDFVSSGINARVTAGTPPFLSVVSLEGSIRLAGGFTHEAQLVALGGELETFGPGEIEMRGGLCVKTLTGASLSRGGVLTFLPQVDPTQPYSPDFPHYVDLYQVWMAPLPASIERSG